MAIPDYFWQVLLEADRVGLKIEMVGGVPMWEAMPGPRHQQEVDRIRDSVEKSSTSGSCEGVHLNDVAVRFQDDSFKRPDISIFCSMPPELDEATRQVPEAVVEVISPGFEAKDLTFGLPFYLSQGVKDVIVYDPRTLVVVHARTDGTKHVVSPISLTLECGCRVTI